MRSRIYEVRGPDVQRYLIKIDGRVSETVKKDGTALIAVLTVAVAAACIVAAYWLISRILP